MSSSGIASWSSSTVFFAGSTDTTFPLMSATLVASCPVGPVWFEQPARMTTSPKATAVVKCGCMVQTLSGGRRASGSGAVRTFRDSPRPGKVVDRQDDEGDECDE